MRVKVSLQRKELKKLVEEKSKTDRLVNIFIGLIGTLATGVYFISYYKGQVSLVYPVAVGITSGLIVGALEYYDRKKIKSLNECLDGDEDEHIDVTLEVADIKV